MSKKVISILLSAAMLVAILCVGFGAVTAAADTTYHKGDVITAELTLQNIDAITGFSDSVFYNSSALYFSECEESVNGTFNGLLVLNPDPEEGTHSNPGEIIIAATFSNIKKGESTFAGDAAKVLTFKFEVTQDTDDLGLKSVLYDYSGFVDGELKSVTIDNDVYSNIVVTNVEKAEPVSDTDDTDDTDSASDTDDTDSASDTDTASETDTTTSETDTTTSETDTETATDTNTESTNTETNTESTNTESTNTESTNTETNTSGTDTSSNSGTSSTTSTTSTTTTTTTSSTVATAGTFAVISLVVILMAAAAVVLYTRKKTEE